MNYKDTVDAENPIEIRQATDRLYHRLKKFGYLLQKGKIVTAKDEHIQLKRVSVQRGFRITNSTTCAIEAGDKFDLTLEQVNKFWEQQLLRRMETKRIEEAQKKRDKVKNCWNFSESRG